VGNYVLALAREDDIKHDPFGTGMAWQFAVCENLAALGSDVPYAVGYASGAGGPVLESWEDQAVYDYLTDVTGDPDARRAEVEYAARILERFLGWVKAAGRDY
jgi:hypothetical protein